MVPLKLYIEVDEIFILFLIDQSIMMYAVVTNISLNEAGSNALKANSVTMCKVKYYMRDATVFASKFLCHLHTS